MAFDDLPANPTAAPLLVGMRRLIEAMHGVRETLERRESRSPGQFAIWPGGFRTQPQLRIKTLIVCPLAAGSYGIKIGTNVTIRFNAGATGIISIPAEITLNRGETITVVDLATGQEATNAQLVDAFMFAYSDAPESKGAATS